MKNKLLAIIATFGLVASASAVKVNDNLSINGFIDGSYQLTDNSGATADTQSLGLDEVEINFNLNVGNVSGSIQIDNNNERAYTSGFTAGTASAITDDNNTSNDTDSSPSSATNRTQNDLDIEQAFFTYNVNDSVSVTFGRYGSALGFEREDPAGLYTFSRAYNGGFNLGDADSRVRDGISIAYAADSFSLAASIEEAAGTDLETEDLNLELSFTFSGIEGLNIGGGFFFDNQENAADETDILNLHVSKQVGKLLLAAEYIESSSDAGDNDAYLLLADYDVNDKLGVAVRFSQNEQGANADYEKFTIAPNYAITDSLGAILEYSDVDNDNAKAEEYAVELTYTF